MYEASYGAVQIPPMKSQALPIKGLHPGFPNRFHYVAPTITGRTDSINHKSNAADRRFCP